MSPDTPAKFQPPKIINKVVLELPDKPQIAINSPASANPELFVNIIFDSFSLVVTVLLTWRQAIEPRLPSCIVSIV